VGGYCTRAGATLKVQTTEHDAPEIATCEHVI